MNNLLAKIGSESIITTYDLIYAAAAVITENAGVKIEKERNNLSPCRRDDWKIRRIRIRKDLSRVEELKKGRKIKENIVLELQRKC